MAHIGRFAPSPSGLLHFGSFITALGSYLQIKSQQGKWLVRIEDIDPPREVSGAASEILRTLEKLGLHWDQEVVYQSDRLPIYQEIINDLLSKKHAYYCHCTRHRIQSFPDHAYDNHCRNLDLLPDQDFPMAIRLKETKPIYKFIDLIRGNHFLPPKIAEEDLIIRRKDGFIAYNLAVVIDDHFQGITDIVRGADLLPVTAKQMSIYQKFEWKIPKYYHLPLVLDKNNNKLSKQNHAKSLDLSNIPNLIIQGLQFLNQKIPEDWQDGTEDQLLQWAIKHWDLNLISKIDKIQ